MASRRALPVLALAALAALLVLAIGIRWFVAPSPSGPAMASAPAPGSRDLPESPEVEDGSAARLAERRPPSATAGEPGAAAASAATPEGGARLRVRVLDGRNSRPLTGFRLLVLPETQALDPFELVTDDAGEASSEAELKRGILGLRHEGQAGSTEFERQWELEETSLFFDERRADSVVELRARAPSFEVWVEARRADGSPVVQREIQLVAGVPGADGEIRWRRRRFATTDGRGLARFLLYDDDYLQAALAICLREALEDEVSDTLYVDPPVTRGPWRLQLYRGNQLAVRVVSADGSPVPNVRVAADLHQKVRTQYTRLIDADERGEVRFRGLAHGEYTVSAFHATRPQRLALGHVELPLPGAELVLRLAEEPIEELVVSGRVLEPDGTPATEGALLVACDGGERERVFVDEDGTFDFHSSAPCTEVVVYAAASVYADPIEPEIARVPAGTTGLEFRRTRKTEQVMALFELVDAMTQKPIGDELDAAIVLYREPAEGLPVTARTFFGPDDGAMYVDFHAHPDLRWLVSVPGYQEQRGDLRAPAAGAEPDVYRIELRRGFAREIVVRDTANGRRLGGVEIRDAHGRALATTSSDGSAALSAAEWPGPLELVRVGYEPLPWDPNAHWNHFSPNVWMRAAASK